MGISHLSLAKAPRQIYLEWQKALSTSSVSLDANTFATDNFVENTRKVGARKMPNSPTRRAQMKSKSRCHCLLNLESFHLFGAMNVPPSFRSLTLHLNRQVGCHFMEKKQCLSMCRISEDLSIRSHFSLLLKSRVS